MRSEGYCSWVCLSVCLLSHISPMERLFGLKTLSRTQQATKVKKFVGFSLKPLRCRDPALPPLYGHAYSRPFFHAYFSCTRMRISRVLYAHDTPPRVQHFSAFHFFMLFIETQWLCCTILHTNSVFPHWIAIYSAVRTRITGILLSSSWIHNTPVHNLCLCTYPVAQKRGVAPRSRDMSWLHYWESCKICEVSRLSWLT